MIDKLKHYLIKLLGGYTKNETLDEWLFLKLRQQLSKNKPRTIDVYDDYSGTYIVKIKFIK